jgi:large subunit ribosomal protein L1
VDKQSIHKSLEELKKLPKKKFSQSYDFIINLKGVDLKTTPLDVSATLPFERGIKVKIAAFVDQGALAEQAAKFCDLVIKETELSKYADKKTAKKLAQDYDLFISQANLMPKVAAALGKYLGSKGKMPNPKMGCVVPPNANLEALCKKLRYTVRLQAKKALNLQCMVGKENQDDEQIAENILAVYHAVVKQLPQDENQNIKNVCLKLTMSKPVRI